MNKEDLNVCTTRYSLALEETQGLPIIYGLGPSGLAADLRIPLDLARQYYYGHKKEFAVMHKFLESVGIQAIERGYCSTLLGRKRFFHKPTYPEHVRAAYFAAKKAGTENRTLYKFSQELLPNYLDYKKSVDSPMSFQDWREKGPGITDEVKKYMSESSAIMREAGNHPIQGGNADITKHAMVMVRNRLKERGYYPHAHTILQVYDELVVEAPTKWRDDVGEILDKAMKEAGELIIKHIPVTVDGHIKHCWTK